MGESIEHLVEEMVKTYARRAKRRAFSSTWSARIPCPRSLRTKARSTRSWTISSPMPSSTLIPTPRSIACSCRGKALSTLKSVTKDLGLSEKDQQHLFKKFSVHTPNPPAEKAQTALAFGSCSAWRRPWAATSAAAALWEPVPPLCFPSSLLGARCRQHRIIRIRPMLSQVRNFFPGRLISA